MPEFHSISNSSILLHLTSFQKHRACWKEHSEVLASQNRRTFAVTQYYESQIASTTMGLGNRAKPLICGQRQSRFMICSATTRCLSPDQAFILDFINSSTLKARVKVNRNNSSFEIEIDLSVNNH